MLGSSSFFWMTDMNVVAVHHMLGVVLAVGGAGLMAVGSFIRRISDRLDALERDVARLRIREMERNATAKKKAAAAILPAV